MKFSLMSLGEARVGSLERNETRFVVVAHEAMRRETKERTSERVRHQCQRLIPAEPTDLKTKEEEEDRVPSLSLSRIHPATQRSMSIFLVCRHETTNDDKRDNMASYLLK